MARTFGWVRDMPDHRDFRYEPRLPPRLPPACDLRPSWPPVRSQGDLNSCTAHAVTAAIEFDLTKQGLVDFRPSRLFVYYNARVREHTIRSNTGVPTREAIKSVKALGVCPERLWRYDPGRFARRPTPRCYHSAKRCRIASYHRLDRNLTTMKACLLDGYPFLVGLVCYSGFTSLTVEHSGVAELPGPREHRVGNHVVMVVGYDDRDERFIVRNSWGVDWGKHGYFTLPYEYLEDEHLSGDFWTVRAVTEIK